MDNAIRASCPTAAASSAAAALCDE